jgi:pimeloyl-ACP methyl ester carboxylesterase
MLLSVQESLLRIRMAITFARVNGTEIAYRQDGLEHPESIVMIHAGICDSRMWQAQLEHFGKRYRVMALDMRGFGQSKMVEGRFAHHEDVLGLMDRLAIRDAWLMACSQGGKVALNLTLEHPERVRGLILVAPAIGGYRYTGAPHRLEDALEEAENTGNLELVSEIEVQVWVDGGRKPTDIDAEMRKLVWEMNLIPLGVDETLWEQEKPLEPPAMERLESIDKRSLLVYGDLDIPASLERVEILATRLKEVKKVLMPNTAHLPNMEAPDVFNGIVDEFLA